jgi:hypothetical protein
LANEIFVMHAIIVEAGKSPYAVENWLAYNAQQFEL